MGEVFLFKPPTMSVPHDNALPYPYDPPRSGLQANAFGPVFKGLAWAIVLGLLAWLLRLDIHWHAKEAALVGVAWCMLAYIVWHIQRSQIRLDAQALEQTWMWRRRMPLKELAYAKVMRIRGLEFLIAPRVYVRNLSGSFAFFYCHDRAMLDELDRLAQALRQHDALNP